MTDLTRIRSISYLKSHAAQMAEDLALSGQPYVITQNGEARMVMESVERYQEKENLVALLKIIVLGEQDRLDAHGQSLEEVQRLLAQDRSDRRG